MKNKLYQNWFVQNKISYDALTFASISVHLTEKEDMMPVKQVKLNIHHIHHGCFTGTVAIITRPSRGGKMFIELQNYLILHSFFFFKEANFVTHSTLKMFWLLHGTHQSFMFCCQLFPHSCEIYGFIILLQIITLPSRISYAKQNQMYWKIQAFTQWMLCPMYCTNVCSKIYGSMCVGR